VSPPFLVGSPALGPHLYGRSAQIEALMEGHWTWVCSQRRMGKTSLLHRVRERLEAAGAISLFFDLVFVPSGAGPRELVRRFLLENAKKISEVLGPARLDTELGQLSPAEALTELARRLSATGRRVAFIWDEAEKLIQLEAQEPFLDALGAGLMGVPQFQMLLGASQVLSDLLSGGLSQSSYLGHFRWMPLRGLEPQDAEALLMGAQVPGWKSPLPAIIIEQVLRISGCHPWIVQDLGYRLYELTERKGERATMELLQRAYSQLAANAVMRATVEDDFSKLTAVERAVLRVVCSRQASTSIGEICHETGLEAEDVQRGIAFLSTYGYTSFGDAVGLQFEFYRKLLPAKASAQPGIPTQARCIPNRPRIFVSYSRRDTPALDELMECLRPLAHSYQLEPWIDTRIRPGEQWLREIEQALTSASAAVLLVSRAFMDSPFIREVEVPRLLRSASRNRCRILVVHVEPSPVADVSFDIDGEHFSLSSYQAVNDPKRTLSEVPPGPERARLIVEMARKIIAEARNTGT
jgi:hypothetical protein